MAENSLYQNSFEEEVNYVSFEFNGLDSRQMKRVFNSLLYELQNLTKVGTDTLRGLSGVNRPFPSYCRFRPLKVCRIEIKKKLGGSI